MASPANQKILLVTNIPTPYRIPLFDEIADALREGGSSLKVVFGAQGYRRRRWVVDLSKSRFDYVILHSRPFYWGNHEKAVFAYSGLLGLIRREKPDVIVSSGFSIATLKVWLHSWVSAVPYLIWSGDILNDGRRLRLRTIQRSFLIRRAAGFIAYGTRAKEYLVSLGADPSRIATSINTVDIAFMRDRARQASAAKPRSSDSKRHLLSVGYLSPQKNIIKLLNVIEVLSSLRHDFVLDVVGDGDDRGRLEEHVRRCGLEQYVMFHGFKQRNELPGYFALADCFLFQTDFDIWGLVLNEAMAAALPCIVSVHAGAASDLVEQGRNGFVMDFADAGPVAEKIDWLLNHPDDARLLGENARRFIENHADLKSSARSFLRALESR
jgi:glycosyltransferase involved in cell wall biosynthesis